MSRVYEALATALAAHDVDDVFCVLGDGNLDLLVELAERHGVRLVHARHEQGAVAMADGYARRSGRLGVCSVTHGPGVTQTGTSLRVAASHRSRVLLLAGDTPTEDPGHIQSFEQAPFVRATGATPVPLLGPRSWPVALAEALRRVEEGPVVLNLPTDYQLAAAGEQPFEPSPRVRPVAVADRLDEAVSALTGAHTPVVIAGRGARGAASELAALMARLPARLATTLAAKGLLHDHPANLGLIGGLGDPEAVRAVEQADWLFVVGASLNPWSTLGGRLLEGKALIRLDHDPGALSEPPLPELALLGDVAATLRALVSRLPSSDGVRPIAADRTPEGRTEFDDGIDSVDPRRALVAVEHGLPTDRALVFDGGHFITFACTALSVTSPDRFVFSCDFATVGQGLGMAVGASVASPDPRTTLIVGDGGFLMSVAELDTAVRYRLPLNVVVLNDGAYGQEAHSLVAKGKPSHHAVFDVPDLANLGDAFGAEGYRLTCSADLDRLPELLQAAGGPRVIEIRINREVVSPAAREIFRQVRRGVNDEGED